jgi:hypothetical protein
MRKPIARRAWSSCALAVLISLVVGASAVAADSEWRLWAVAPDGITNDKPVAIQGWLENVGQLPLTGSVTVTHTFPIGLAPVDPGIEGGFGSSCHIIAQASVCDINVDGLVSGGQVRFKYETAVAGASGTLIDTIQATGGGMISGQTSEQAMTVGVSEPFAVKQFGVGLADQNGASAMQAGSSPSEIVNALVLRSVAADQFGTGAFSVTAPTEHLRDTSVRVPPGFVGNPTVTPAKCSGGQMTQPSPQSATQSIPNCPQGSQIGFARILSSLGPALVPLYNLVPPVGSPAAFGFTYQAITVILTAKLRPSDNGIDIVAKTSPSSVPITAVYVTMWGVPADAAHDHMRHLCMDGFHGSNGNMCPSDAPSRPFLRLPTSCPGSPLPWSVDVNSYEDPFNLEHAATSTPAIEGCQHTPFDPALTLTPTTATAHSPTGLDATLTIPQDYGPLGLSQADLRTATVTLPDGMTINPSSAGGLKACADADLELGQEGPSSCPDGAKIGTVRLTTPLLDHPLGGFIWLRPQNSQDPASGELFRIAVEVRSDDDGVHLKLPGAVRADPDTGRLTTTFDQLPQLPFSAMHLQFKSGPRAPLTTPRTCGAQSAPTLMTGWNDKVVPDQATFSVDGCAPVQLSPTFRAGSDDPQPGIRTPLQLSLGRDDADDLFRTLDVDTTTGLLGRIKDARECASAAADAGSCSSASLIGRVTAGAGVGPNPFFIPDGKVFLTGPYRGAPYGLSVVVRALAGPFDLGTVVVRAAIHVDRHTAALRVVSDPFPTVVKGVPLNLRAVRISIDKPGFMVTPTSCAKKSIDATVTSISGLTARISSPYRLAGCGDLPFAPKLTLSVGAPGRTGFRQSTPFTATLTQRPGQANIKRVKVSLPTTLSALLPVVDRACTREQFEAENCRRAEVGSAIARSPLLPNALKGGAYFVKHPGQPLPDMVVALRGDVSIDLIGKVTIPGGKQLATDFKAVPDAAIRRFTLRLRSGRNGPLGVARNLCSRQARRATASVTMQGQNGKTIDRQQRLRIKGCGGGRSRQR